jgi:4'-phosphopantetheinyl transferase
MIHWLVQSTAVHPKLAIGAPPPEMLSGDEKEHLTTLTKPKRRADWLLGRWTAKHLLQDLFRRECGFEAPLDALSILNGVTHAPVVKCHVNGIVGATTPSLSISHSNRHAFCAAVRDPARTLGADMERIEPRSPAFVRDYFTAAERELIHETPRPMQDTLVNAIWSGKEATLKALQLGLTVDTRGVTCLIDPPPAAPPTWTPFAIECDSHYLRDTAPPLTGWWRVWDEFVLTLVMGE